MADLGSLTMKHATASKANDTVIENLFLDRRFAFCDVYGPPAAGFGAAGFVFPDESASIGGTVQVEGTATAQIRVSLHKDLAGRLLRTVKTDESGAYLFERVAPGIDYYVVIRSPDSANYNNVVYLLPATA